LEAIANKPIRIASLPGGDLTNRVVDGAKAAGMQALCTSIPGVNTEKTSYFAMRRIPIRYNTSEGDVKRYLSNNTYLEIFRWALFMIPHRILGGRRYVYFRRWFLGEKNSEQASKVFDP
jgi:hypothetical protein